MSEEDEQAFLVKSPCGRMYVYSFTKIARSFSFCSLVDIMEALFDHGFLMHTSWTDKEVLLPIELLE